MFSGVAFAEESNKHLDIKQVVETRKTVQDGVWIADIDKDISFETDTYKEGEVVYVLHVIEDPVYGNYHNTATVTYLECNTDYGIRYIPAAVTEDYNYIVKPKPRTVTSTPSNDSTVGEVYEDVVVESSGEGYAYSKTVKITTYCAACNTPRHSKETASGVPAYVGGCAMRGVPFGTVVHTSHGDFTVIDRCASSSVLDIYIGDYESCPCTTYGTETVYWN